MSRMPSTPGRGPGATVRRWHVTAPHRAWGHVDGVPFETAHLKEVGGARTACGVPAADWVMFWRLRPRDLPGLCRACLVASSR